MVTVTEGKVLLWGLQRLGAKIDESDSYDSFDHIYSAGIYLIHALNINQQCSVVVV